MSKDKLKELFHDELYNHETPVQPSDWEIIRERMNKKRKRKIVPLFYIYSTTGIVAALLIVMFLLNPKSENINDEVTAKIDTQSIQNIENKKNILDTVDNSATIADNSFVSENKNEKDINSVNKSNSYVAANEKINFNEHGDPHVQKPIRKIEEVEIEENTQDELIEKQNEAQKNINYEWWNMPDTEQNKTKNTSSWTLAFVSGQKVGNNSTTSDFTNDVWTKRFDSERNKQYSYNSILSSLPYGERSTLASTPYVNLDKIKDMKHNHPLNFGVRIKKNISDKIRIKTGLSYSYFLSEFNSMDVKIQQKIHYIGIPVGAEFLLWKKNRFNLYASGEFAVEKGVAYYFNSLGLTIIGTTDVITDKGSVRGLQFSTNAGLGVSYSFIKNFGIYVEPNAVYYIKDSRQPQSFRTEKPLNFGLNIGLKYDF